MNEEKVLLSEVEVERALTRIAHEILEKNKGSEGLALVGLHSGGAKLAGVLGRLISGIEKVEIPVGAMEIALYRDDAARHAAPVRQTSLPFNVEGRKIVLVDDVLFTGRSIRAAMDGIIDFGRPALIQLAVLVDRGHRELPVHADYVGRDIPTALSEGVRVIFDEDERPQKVILVPGDPDEEPR